MQRALSSLNSEEREALEEMKLRFKHNLPPKLQEDQTLFYRFLKARDFDVDKAESMLRKNISWRKAHRVDALLESFQPREVFHSIRVYNIGFDKEGNLLNYAPSGKVDIRDVLRAFKLNDYIKHFIWAGERDILTGLEENKKTGRDAFQEIVIFNLEDCPLTNVTHKGSADLMLRAMAILQDNYPERMKALYIINAPVYFPILFSIMKKVMSNAMLNKTHVFAQSGWREALLQEVDADVLPAFLGGNRTDPDGDPTCKFLNINHEGKVDGRHFLSEEERHFRDPSRVLKVSVPARDSVRLRVEVARAGSVLEWEFEAGGKEVGFGLLRQLDEWELEELLPVHRVATVDGSERDSVVAQEAGTYIILFDNTRGWWSSKEVEYCITVREPDPK